MTATQRKGARSIKDIPADILQQLNTGAIETVNLVEWLAVDQQLLLENILRQHHRTAYLKPILKKVSELKKQTVNTVNEAIGTGLFEQTTQHNDQEFAATMSKHSADLVRCWATYAIGKDERRSIKEILQQIQPFSADKHFGVREICWMAVRPKIAGHLRESIDILSTWTGSNDENIRRFATESTRPRGIWCAHIEALKQHPELALPILEPLRSDEARYVRDSVGNWLNDASKSQPAFVKHLCQRWEAESNTTETKYTIKKALRTLNK